MRLGLLSLWILLAMPPWAGAQTADPATRELIEKLLSRIDTLEKRVAQLENPGARTAAPAPAVPSPTELIHATHDTAPLPEAVQPVYPSLKLSGFSDFNFSSTDLHGPSGGFAGPTLLGAHSGFQEGQFALHL